MSKGLNQPKLNNIHIELKSEPNDREKRIKELLAKAIAHYIENEQGLE